MGTGDHFLSYSEHCNYFGGYKRAKEKYNERCKWKCIKCLYSQVCCDRNFSDFSSHHIPLCPLARDKLQILKTIFNEDQDKIEKLKIICIDG